eukprot:5103424-Alexandrium_andersonii.AAC.1
MAEHVASAEHVANRRKQCSHSVVGPLGPPDGQGSRRSLDVSGASRLPRTDATQTEAGAANS